MRADFVTAVLPVRVTGTKESSDLDRVERLLLPSFSLFWHQPAELEFLVVVPPADLQHVSARLVGASDFRVRVISEDGLCPDLAGHAGWHKQQILKLAAAKAVLSVWYLTLDADVILRRPTSLADLVPGGRSTLKQETARDHWDWWQASRGVLRTTVPLDRADVVMGVTPELLRRDLVLDLLGEIEQRNGADSAGRFLFDERERGWTEYSLYWLYVLERGLEQQLYDWTHPNLYEGIWFRDQVADPEFVQRLFRPSSDAHFLVLQSNLRVPLRDVERLVASHLRLTARGPSLVDLALAGVRRTLARMSSGLSSAWGALKEEVEVGP